MHHTTNVTAFLFAKIIFGLLNRF